MNLTTLQTSFWGYALESAARILNMVLTKKVERTPYEIWHGKAPKLSYLRVWGYEALVKRDTSGKLDPRSIKCIFVGYPKETMGYYFYYPLKNNMFVARNAEFFKNSLMVQEASGSRGLLESSRSDRRLELIQEEDTQPFENTSEVHNEVAPIKVEPQNVEVPIHIRAIGILLAIAAFYDYEIWQMDVKIAFLNGHLIEDVYMVQPERYKGLKTKQKRTLQCSWKGGDPLCPSSTLEVLGSRLGFALYPTATSDATWPTPVVAANDWYEVAEVAGGLDNKGVTRVHGDEVAVLADA
ncbi:retrovirus-related pol polyprotein from transposon TNT 1-94 [Tanacetum coccineum]|uniref:Retrovirus-related pol polyprotein from transposon TNT 1-94 n=1 Tax=Tanacetum coccineum TaxID=301880 RepID=A0ABQ5EUP0_9ASTR